MYFNYTSIVRCVIYLFLSMQIIVLNIIYGWTAMVLCIHLASGVIGAINIISIDERNFLSVTLELKIISHVIIWESMYIN